MKMSQTSCPACGVTVDLATIKGTDEKVPLEKAPETEGSADRYRIVNDHPLTVVKVPAEAAGAYYPDHRYDCPGFNAGR